jgi:hypothetical protein
MGFGETTEQILDVRERLASARSSRAIPRPCG